MKNLKKLTLLHSNDLHGDFLAERIDNKLVGGVSMLSGYINKVRAEEENVIYCIAGDMFRGSVIDAEYKGVSTIEIMNLLGPDVVTIGNHEVDYGLSHLLFIEKCANFPIINANFHIRTNNKRLFQPFYIAHIDGMKILFIGIITEDVLAQTKMDKVIGSFVDICEAAEEIGRICNTYNPIDIDFTIILTHIGFEEDKKLAAMLDPDWGVDVIIGGHSHTFLEHPVKVNDILIVSKGYVLKATYVKDLGGKQVIPTGNLNVIRVNNSDVLPLYLYIFLMSDKGQALLKQSLAGALMKSLSKKALDEMDIPAIDLDTQEVIENRYLILQDKMEKLKKDLKDLEEKQSSIFESEVES